MTPDFFISDTHFGHVNILKYEPLRQEWGENPAAMTAYMIAAWNSVVRPHHTVLHLGDFAMGLKDNWPLYRQQLNGRIILVRGNHDPKPGHKHWDLLAPIEVHDRYEFECSELGKVVCRHDPHHFTEEDHDVAAWLFHGHLHSGHHRADTPEHFKRKAVCLSVERLDTRPAPVSLNALAFRLGNPQTY